MCGIVGLYIKNPELEESLGDHLSSMLIQMTDRGPDSAGVAFYRNPVGGEGTKLSLFSSDPDYPWKKLVGELTQDLDDKATLEVRGSHAVIVTHEAFPTIQAWLKKHHPDLRICLLYTSPSPRDS